MRILLKSIRDYLRRVIKRRKEAEQLKAGKKWDYVVEELRKKKYK